MLVILGMVPSLLLGLKLMADEPYYRNSLDVPRAPEHYPIRSLIEKAEVMGRLKKGDALFVNNPKERFITQSLQLGYVDLIKKYQIKNNPQSFDNPLCSCRQAGIHVMLPRFYHSGVLPVPEIPRQRIEKELACVESIKANCSGFVEHLLRDGQIIGILGLL